MERASLTVVGYLSGSTALATIVMYDPSHGGCCIGAPNIARSPNTVVGGAKGSGAVAGSALGTVCTGAATVEIGAGGTSGAVGALVPIVAGELGCTVVVVLVVEGAAVVVVVEVVAGTVTAGIVDEVVDVVAASGVAAVRFLDEVPLGCTESFEAMRSLFVAQLVAKNASRISLPMRRPFACLTAARSGAALDAIINVAGPSAPHALEALPKP